MTNETNTNSGGIGLCGILTIIFVIAKITGYITWNWWWVFSPLWLPLTIGLAILLIILIIKELI